MTIEYLTQATLARDCEGLVGQHVMLHPKTLAYLRSRDIICDKLAKLVALPAPAKEFELTLKAGDSLQGFKVTESVTVKVTDSPSPLKLQVFCGKRKKVTFLRIICSIEQADIEKALPVGIAMKLSQEEKKLFREREEVVKLLRDMQELGIL